MRILSVAACLLLFVFTASVSADAVIYPETGDVEIDGTGEGSSVDIEHYDSEPFKGSLLVSVKNTSDTAWGDFHFQIFQIPGQGAIDNVFFYDNITGEEPTSSQTLDDPGWTISPDGHQIDLWYYGDPVGTGESAWFKVWTDNQTNNVNFGVCFWATPVPEPATMALLGLGLLGLVVRRKRS